VAVFARTKDGRAAGSIMLMDQKGSGKLLQRRTLHFVGQLIGEDGKPSVDVRVVASLATSRNMCGETKSILISLRCIPSVK